MARSANVVVVGGGIVGLASARSLVRRGVRNVLVVEAESEVATHQTGHNSGVIHSGIYYKPGSLKARNCIAGREALYRYCEEAGIPCRRSGKILVATRESELPALEELRRRGEANGLKDMRMLGVSELRELEPEVSAIAGVWVQEAGIVDYRQVALAFARDILEGGGEIRTGTAVLAVHVDPAEVHVTTTGEAVSGRVLVNCAGLQSDRVARLCGVRPPLKIVPFRGEYYQLKEAAARRVRNPIYPVPDPTFPFLGVHLTPTIDGRVEAGPNAVLAWKREGYRKTDFSLRDLSETLGYSGFRRLAIRHWRAGAAEVVRSFSRRLFVRDLQRLVPAIQPADVVPGKTGVRAQAVTPDGKLLDDFSILHHERTIHVLNAPSPAATASLSIGDHIADLVLGHGLVSAAS